MTTEGIQYPIVLSTGKKVVLREMKTKDMLVMDKQSRSKNLSEIESSIRMIERLSIDPGKITVTEIQELNLKDFRALGDLLVKAGGLQQPEDENEDEDLGNL